MRLKITPGIIEKYPQVEVGWLTADITPLPMDPKVEQWKGALAAWVSSQGITSENLSSCPEVAGWRQVFGSMGVKPSKYRCSLEALLRRVLKENSLWTVNSVVDLYNCVSVRTLFPMGAFDLEKVKGDLSLRFGREGETFSPLGKGDEERVSCEHVVYADSEKVCCWLWNHRDSRLVGLDETSRRAVFFVDRAFSPTTFTMEDALQALEENLAEIGARVTGKGVCTSLEPHQSILEVRN
jgi:lysyl-tRNA synthetase class 2